MISARLIAGSLPIAAATTLEFRLSSGSMPDWIGMLRTVMMVLGGLVVIAIVLVVAVAVISGVMGMIGGLRKRS